MLITDFQIASRNLARHTKRNALLAAAIAAVTALLVLLAGLAAGIRASMLESATTLMTGHVNVGGFFKITSGTGFPLVGNFENVLAETRKLVPELDFATVRGRGYVKAVSDTGSMDLVLGGLDIQNEPRFRAVVRVAEGTLDGLLERGTILLFEGQAKRLGVHAGDAITLTAPTARGVANTADVRVAAVARSVGILSAINAYIPSGDLQKLYQLKAGTTGAIHLYLKDPAASARVAARLRGGLAGRGFRVMEADPKPYWEKFLKVNSEDWIGQKLDVTTWEDEMSFLTWILTALQGLSGLLVTILMVIVVIGIMNTLAIAIRERTREIGTLRAIGMQRTKVLWLLLLEMALLGATGTAAGSLAGAGAAALVNAAHFSVPESARMFLMQEHVTLALRLGSVATAAAAIAAVTTLAALYPALHAARLAPVTAMHHIG